MSLSNFASELSAVIASSLLPPPPGGGVGDRGRVRGAANGRLGWDSVAWLSTVVYTGFLPSIGVQVIFLCLPLHIQFSSAENVFPKLRTTDNFHPIIQNEAAL